jgi:putative transposase
MPRISRIVGVGLPHHITQRGNYKQDVFESDFDRDIYLKWVNEYTRKYGVSVVAYCLMRNHVHFVAVPKSPDSLGRAFRCAHMRYSLYFNSKHGLNGHLWQGRFYSCVLGGGHFLNACVYVERNPVRAGLVETPTGWAWSSARAHCSGQADSSRLEVGKIWDMSEVSAMEWENLISGPENDVDLNEIRLSTQLGRPLGDKLFVSQLERNMGRRLHALPIGRPFEINRDGALF